MSESITITQTSPSYSPVCPEDDVVLTCQGTSNNTFLVFRASNSGTLQAIDNTNIINTNLNGIVLHWRGMNGTDLTATATISDIPLNMNGVIISFFNKWTWTICNGESQHNRFDIINKTNYTMENFVVKTLSHLPK